MNLPPRARLAFERLRPVVPAAVIVAALALVPFNTCVLRRLAGIPCPGCGFTRAVLCLLHGDVAGSVRMHPLALPGAALGVVTVALAFALPPASPAWERFAQRAVMVSALALVGAWALRLVGVLAAV